MPNVPRHGRTRSTHRLRTRATHDYDASTYGMMEGASQAADQDSLDGVVGPGGIPAGTIDIGRFIPSVRPVAVFDTVASLPTLPDPLYPVGQTAIVLDLGTVYKNVANVWTAGVGSISGGIESVAVLPTLPHASYPVGAVVFYTVDGKLYRNIADAWSKAVDGGDITASTILADSIAAGQITAAKIDTGAVTAEKLESVLALVTMLVAGDIDAQHVEIDGTGIILYDVDDQPVVYIPTDPDLPVFVSGNVTAGTLITQQSAEFRESVSLASGATMVVQGKVSAPTAAPVLAASIPTAFTFTPAPGDVLDVGMAWDSASTSWYMAYWIALGTTPYIYEFDADGTSIRSQSLGLSISDSVRGIGVNATHIFLLTFLNTTGAVTLRKLDRTTLASVSTAVITTDISGTNGNCCMFYDATDSRIVVVTANGEGGARAVRFRKYDTSLVLQSTVTAASNFITSEATTSFKGGARVGSSIWVAADWNGAGTPLVYEFDPTTAAADSTTYFGTANSVSRVGLGLGYNGSNFFGQPSSGRGTVYQFTNRTHTDALARHWVGYSWYDPDATTHETELGPRSSIVLTRRSRLQVSNATIPGAGGADDPDNVRVYMAQTASGGSEPAAGSYKRQSTDALTVRDFDSFDSGGAADPTTNDFPNATPGVIQSQGTGWSLSGDGTGALGLTVTGGKPPIMRVLTSGTGATWSKPAGLSHITVEVQGGGGGSGAAPNPAAGETCVSAGGGGGGYAKCIYTAADLAGASSFSYTVGGGGGGGTSGASGSAGSASSFSGTGITTLQGNGGNGGEAATSGTTTVVTAGGTGGGGSGPSNTLVVQGGDGGNGIRVSGTAYGALGFGGGSFLSGSQRPGAVNLESPGRAGAVYGGGASGAYSKDGSGNAGADGAAGVVIITEYYVG